MQPWCLQAQEWWWRKKKNELWWRNEASVIQKENSFWDGGDGYRDEKKKKKEKGWVGHLMIWKQQRRNLPVSELQEAIFFSMFLQGWSISFVQRWINSMGLGLVLFSFLRRGRLFRVEQLWTVLEITLCHTHSLVIRSDSLRCSGGHEPLCSSPGNVSGFHWR